MATDEGVVLLPGEGRGDGSGRNLTKVDAAHTRGAYSLREVVVPPGRSIPAHVHRDVEEAWYVLEGELTFRLGDRTFRGPAGTFVLGPRGLVHSYGNPGTEPAKVLMIFSPAGFERYFEERNALAQTSHTAGRTDYAGLDEETHAALAKKYGIEFVESTRP